MISRTDTDRLLARHPAAVILPRLFPKTPRYPSRFRPTGLSRTDYLPLLAGNVDFFRKYQNEHGAIIDPYEKAERQYATPAFALAAALLAREANREDLREPATSALTLAIDALARRTTANNHPDFYIPLVIHARRILAPRADRRVADAWTRQLQSLVPEETYRDVEGGGNWNIVNLAGECLRRKDGLVAPERDAAQAAYVERCLERQAARFTRFGMYEDPNAPLAYDAFPRLWLDDILADDAYHGAHRSVVEEFLVNGGLSTLLLLSPSGEWACGGRSAHHQWNEAEVAVICEVNARRWQAGGRPDIAGAFKRAAHLALGSIRRWQRPSGELWIVKNRADPRERHGYEGYSFHSQYNLLAVAMLAIAYLRADETIAETPTPAETGGYVFDVRDTFHKICASAGGTYVLLDTAADPHYNATGLLRVHKQDVPFSPYSDNAAGHRNYGPPGNPERRAMSPGIRWKESLGGPWRSLADFHPPRFETRYGPSLVTKTDLRVHRSEADRAVFTVAYHTSGEGSLRIEEEYTIHRSGVEVVVRLEGAPARTAVLFPLLVSDANADTNVTVAGGVAAVRHAAATLTWEVVAPQNVSLALDGPRVPTHNGFLRAAIADLPEGTRELRWRLRLEGEGV